MTCERKLSATKNQHLPLGRLSCAVNIRHWSRDFTNYTIYSKDVKLFFLKDMSNCKIERKYLYMNFRSKIPKGSMLTLC